MEKYNKGKNRISIAGTEIQNMPVAIEDMDGNNKLAGEGNVISYNDLSNKPKIGNTELKGSKTAHQLGLATESQLATKCDLSVIAPAYSNKATYAEGDLVIQGGKLYQAKAAISTAEDFTVEHWDERTLAYIIGHLS